jgi:hypothetical protein
VDGECNGIIEPFDAIDSYPAFFGSLPIPRRNAGDTDFAACLAREVGAVGLKKSQQAAANRAKSGNTKCEWFHDLIIG